MKSFPDWLTQEYAATHTADEIAERLGCNKGKAYNWCKTIMGWEILHKPRASKLDCVTKEEAESSTIKQLATRYRYSQSGIAKFIEKKGWKCKPGQPAKIKPEKKTDKYISLVNKTSSGSIGLGYYNVRPKGF